MTGPPAQVQSKGLRYSIRFIPCPSLPGEQKRRRVRGREKVYTTYETDCQKIDRRRFLAVFYDNKIEIE